MFFSKLHEISPLFPFPVEKKPLCNFLLNKYKMIIIINLIKQIFSCFRIQ